MKRVVLPLSRREFFCGVAAGCAALGVVSSCADEGFGVVQTGPLGDNPGDPDARPGSPDARPGSPDARPAPDARPGSPDARPAPDAAPAGSCSASAFDVGAPSTFTTNSPVLFSSHNIYVVRDSNGLYALSSRCTHEGAQNGIYQGEFLCPRHGAEFTFNGAIISGPVNRTLAHYPMCTMSNGHVGVDTSTTCSASTRLNA